MNTTRTAKGQKRPSKESGEGSTLGAMLHARRQAKEPAPLRHRTEVHGSFGVTTVVEGTAEQIIQAGICGPEHLPEGRKRVKFGPLPEGAPSHHWWATRHAGGLIRLRVDRRPAEGGEKFVTRYHDAERALELEESGAAPAQFQDSLRLNVRAARAFLTHKAPSHEGLSLDRASARQLGKLSAQVLALLEKMEAITASAHVEVNADARADYVRRVRLNMHLPLPKLPPLE